jgi:hypothetical protein
MPKVSIKRFLDSPLEPGKPITVRQAIIECNRLGRGFRRNLSRRLGITWGSFQNLEKEVVK